MVNTMDLLEQLLAASSETERIELMTPHEAELAGLVVAWGQAAWAAAQAGDVGRALAIYDLLLWVMSFGGRDALAPTWGRRGHLLLAAGRREEARQSWLRALELYGQPPPNLAGRADIALNLGTSYWQVSDYQAAIPWLQAAIADYDQLPPSPGAGCAHTRLGDCLKELAQWAAALAGYGRARAIFEALGNLVAVADRWNDIGLTQLAAGEPRAAAASLREAVAAAEAAGNPACVCRALESFGYVQGMGLKEYEQALATFRREIAVAAGEQDLTSAHVQAAGLCELLGRWDEAAEHYRLALAESERSGDRVGRAACQEGLAAIYKRQGDYHQAHAAYEEAVTTYRSAGLPVNGAIRILGELGQLAWEWGKPEEALEHYNAALALAQAANDWGWAGFIESTLGALYETALQQPAVARQHYRQAADFFDKAGTAESRLRACRQRGDLALAAGATAEAVAWFEQAAAEAKRGGDRLALADVCRALAGAYVEAGRADAAVRSQRRAVRLYRALGLPQQSAQAWLDLAELYGRFLRAAPLEGSAIRPAQAVRAYRSAARAYRRMDDPGGAALAQVGLAWHYFGRQQYRSAQLALRKALAGLDVQRLESLTTAQTAYLGLAAADERLGRPEKALQNYRQALALAERQRASVILPEFKLSVLGSRQNLYGRAILLAAGQGQPAEAFHHVESSRSRAFLSLLACTPLPQPSGRAPVDLLADETLWLGRLRRLLDAQVAGQITAGYWRELQNAWEHLDALWSAIGDDEYAALRRGQPITLAELRDCLAGLERKDNPCELLTTSPPYPGNSPAGPPTCGSSRGSAR
jgi:tetratricopeptide (TPR) repeat protein